MRQDINLNIHYTAPKHVWDKIYEVYKSMPYWTGDDTNAKWLGDNVELWASVEPSGVQIAGIMPDSLWSEWYTNLKCKLTNVLGYEIGEPEEGYDFKYWE